MSEVSSPKLNNPKPILIEHGGTDDSSKPEKKVMSQRDMEKKMAEDKRLREERDRKIVEHKQRVKALTEAEY